MPAADEGVETNGPAARKPEARMTPGPPASAPPGTRTPNLLIKRKSKVAHQRSWPLACWVRRSWAITRDHGRCDYACYCCPPPVSILNGGAWPGQAYCVRSRGSKKYWGFSQKPGCRRSPRLPRRREARGSGASITRPPAKLFSPVGDHNEPHGFFSRTLGCRGQVCLLRHDQPVPLGMEMRRWSKIVARKQSVRG